MLSKLTKSALDLVFPVHCAGCGREGGVICAVCAEGLARLARPYCDICAAPGVNGVCRWCLEYPRGFDSLRSPYTFEGSVREGIHALKYRGMRAASETLAGLLLQYLERNPLQADVVIPAPLHRRRLRSRGYNQAALLAREIGKVMELPVRENLLVRVSDARPQVATQTREERRLNVAGNFVCKADLGGMAILLIDDVATTGSTLSECALALKEAGAHRVRALTLARDA